MPATQKNLAQCENILQVTRALRGSPAPETVDPIYLGVRELRRLATVEWLVLPSREQGVTREGGVAKPLTPKGINGFRAGA